MKIALKRLGLPYLTAREDLPPNPKGKLTVIWNRVAGNGVWQGSYPGRGSKQTYRSCLTPLELMP